VPHREHYVPKHLSPKEPKPKVEPTRKPLAARLRTALVVSGAAVAVTGLAVSAGIVAESGPFGAPASAALASRQAGDDVGAAPVATRPTVDDGRQTRVVSRSVDRLNVDVQKERSLSQRSGGQVTKKVDRSAALTSSDPRTIAKALLSKYGYGQDQFTCLDSIYSQESGWNTHADNPASSAYGIPQALPGSKMATAGPNWQNDAATQIKWGLGYIKGRYGSPCGAWGFKQAHGWY
jgi:hypothetical protein